MATVCDWHTRVLAALLFLAPWASSQVSPSSPPHPALPANADQTQSRPVVARKPDPLFDLPPLPDSGASLLGGTVQSLDRVRNRLVLLPFGGGSMEIAFDPRTVFLRDEANVSARALQPGDKVHVETILDRRRIFAKKIHITTSSFRGEARGQIVAYDAQGGQFSLNDAISGQVLDFQLTQSTKLAGERLLPGTLVDVNFLPGLQRPEAQAVRVLAVPGTKFVFAGRITFLNLFTRDMVVANDSDNKKYEIKFNPAQVDTARLREGSNVTIEAQFDGKSYSAQTISLVPGAP